jgi:hypothetical protein
MAEAGCGVTPALAARARQMQAEADYRRSVAEFREQHAATLQRQAEALIAEAVAALAELFSRPAHAVCLTCRRALAPRVRNCPHCRVAGRLLSDEELAEFRTGAA